MMKPVLQRRCHTRRGGEEGWGGGAGGSGGGGGRGGDEVGRREGGGGRRGAARGGRWEEGSDETMNDLQPVFWTEQGQYSLEPWPRVLPRKKGPALTSF